jgi:7-cyano-7-deazaguanine reductase
MSIINHGPLGERSEYPRHYDPSVLHPIPRQAGRAQIGFDSHALPFAGVDIWNAYEVSWLDALGKPVVALLELRVPCESACIVESKSLKLYLGSFNNARYASPTDVALQIEKDLNAVTLSQVAVYLEGLSAAGASRFALQTVAGDCIDDEILQDPAFEVAPELLTIEAGADVEETLYSNLLRSNCPVTGQPDWATLIIRYRGQPLQKRALLAYVVSYREHNDFHEQCVERIFQDIQTRCQPRALTVYARYTRRGGIDINPLRSNFTSEPLLAAGANLRLVRQ